jgi:dTDP-4-dehydrorhamnose 3,5-epimerase-like enzyme
MRVSALAIAEVLLTSAPISTTRRAGLAWPSDDSDVGIRWSVDEPLLSARDQMNPRLAQIDSGRLL